jgi:hypothetical protein
MQQHMCDTSSVLATRHPPIHGRCLAATALLAASINSARHELLAGTQLYKRMLHNCGAVHALKPIGCCNNHIVTPVTMTSPTKKEGVQSPMLCPMPHQRMALLTVDARVASWGWACVLSAGRCWTAAAAAAVNWPAVLASCSAAASAAASSAPTAQMV